MRIRPLPLLIAIALSLPIMPMTGCDMSNDMNTTVTHGTTCDDTCDENEGEPAGVTDWEASFVPMTTSEFITAMDDGVTFVAVFGFSACPACQHAMPILARVASETGMTVHWIDTRANPEWKSNTDIDDYDELCERVGTFFPIDGDGRPHLDAPSVFFVKDGSIMTFHDGTLDELDDPNNEMTDEQQERLADIYRDGFESIK